MKYIERRCYNCGSELKIQKGDLIICGTCGVILHKNIKLMDVKISNE